VLVAVEEADAEPVDDSESDTSLLPIVGSGASGETAQALLVKSGHGGGVSEGL